MYLPNKTIRGFTLVELLVVVGIITIITGATIPAFSVYLKNQNLTQAKSQLKSDLRSVQNRALTGVHFDQKVNGNDVKFWGFRISKSSLTGYSYFISDVDTNCTAVPAQQAGLSLPGTLSLPQGVTFVLPPNTDLCLFFSMSDGAITSCKDNCGTSSTASGSISFTDGTKTSSVSYNNAGRISN